MEDAEIIELYFRRSEEAIAESDRKYGAYCSSIAWRILKSREDSEECVSDTWLRAWGAMPPARPRFLRAFFGKITRNLSLGRYERDHAAKRGGGEVSIALDELGECVASPQGEAWSCDRHVLTEVLNSFLREMPAEKRIIFVRRYWYFDSISAIASDLGVSKSKVKMTLLRSRRELAEILGKEGLEV